jgi:predicted protein tyrosine phosphatase
MISPLWERTTISGIRALDDPAGHSHVLSLLDPQWPEPEVFSSWPGGNWLLLRFHDEIDLLAGRILPDEAIIARLLEFGLRLSSANALDTKLFVHCQSGVSRSTAAALILWAQAHPEIEASYLFEHLSRLRPAAWPNSLMLRIADAKLGNGCALSREAPHYFRKRLHDAPKLADQMARLRRQADLDRAAAIG